MTRIIAPLTYRGKADCESAICTHGPDEQGRPGLGPCFGWHCSYCDEPCSYQGHKCEVAETLIAEAERQPSGGEG